MNPPAKSPAERRVLVPEGLSAVLRTAAPPSALVARLEGETMGTRWMARMNLPPRVNLSDLERGIESCLSRIISQMSNWEAGSDICRFNEAASDTWYALPADFLNVVRAALRVAQESDGAFDPTMGALTGLWGFGPAGRPASLPSERTVQTQLVRGGWHKLVLKDDALLQPGGVHLDFSGIAKGYAVDCLSRFLADAGVTNHLVEIGGELRGHGVKPSAMPWWVGLDSGVDIPQTVIALHDIAIATSGSERSFEHEGRSYSHTIDPATGRPLDNEIVSVTVLHSECMMADAYATALMVMGVQRGITFAVKHDIKALFVFRTGKGLMEHLTPACLAMAS